MRVEPTLNPEVAHWLAGDESTGNVTTSALASI